MVVGWLACLFSAGLLSIFMTNIDNLNKSSCTRVHYNIVAKINMYREIILIKILTHSSQSSGVFRNIMKEQVYKRKEHIGIFKNNIYF